ncbi:MAG: DUF2339 domain-containing protein [Spirochaetes bacterium]|nr:DUF2339 domain-containing protein [Spirochaetota bacterium]
MELLKTVLDLVRDQKKNISDLEKSVRELNSHNYIQENADLLRENELLKKEFSELRQKADRLEENNNSLKLILREQIIDEKLSILKSSMNKINTYFGKSKETGLNNLNSAESEMRRGIYNLEKKILSGIKAKQPELLNELNKLKEKYNAVLEEQQKLIESEYKTQMSLNDEKYRKLGSEQVSDDVIQKRIRQNKIELKIGLNWLNKIAVFLFLMGMGVLARYSYAKWFNDYMKGSVFFAAGLLFIAGGEFFHRKTKDVFSKGLLGGGIGILYGALFYSYMLLHILNLETAMMLSIIVTACAALMSLRYKSETIGIISLAGGYLPFFTYVYNYDLTENSIYIAAGYIILLNLFLLIVSVKKQWRVLLPVSYILFAPTLSILSLNMEIFSAQIGFIILLFVLYTVIILGYPLLYKIRLRTVEICILGLNIIVNCSVVFAVFRIHEIQDADGIIALVFALISFATGSLIVKFINAEKTAAVIFYVTALTFAVLMIPFQFGIKWASMGWLVEGIVLTVAGYKNRLKYIEYAGWIISALCSIAFYFYDFTSYYLFYQTEFFPYKFLAVAAGGVIISLFYSKDIYDKKISIYQPQGKAGLVIKYFSAFTLWLFLIVISDYLLEKYENSLQQYSQSVSNVLEFYGLLAVAIFSALTAFIYRNIKIIKDTVMKILSVILYVISVLTVISLSVNNRILSVDFSENSIIRIISIAALILISILSFMIVRTVTIDFIKSSGKSLEIYPPVIVVYLLFQITVLIINQGDFSSENLIISFSFLIIALLSITYGFIKKYVNVRLLGLGLTVFALAKFFFWDLRTLETVGKIFAYFGFAAVFFAISFIYQKVKNIVDMPDVKK